jgi:protein-S-isoprenylcysteine O-methyltransferase Ste14
MLVARAVIGPKILGKRGSGKVLGPMKKEEIPFIICLSIIFASYAYTTFLPLKSGTIWFSAGLFIYLLGMLVVILALLSFHTTQVDKPVTKGVYRISRNPQYVGDFFLNMSISIACLSWIFLLVTIAAVIFEHHMVVSEETACLKR